MLSQNLNNNEIIYWKRNNKIEIAANEKPQESNKSRILLRQTRNKEDQVKEKIG